MSNKTEFAIGEEFQMGLLTLVCVDDSVDNVGCEQCGLDDIWSSADVHCSRYVGDCDWCERTDGKDVIFKVKEG